MRKARSCSKLSSGGAWVVMAVSVGRRWLLGLHLTAPSPSPSPPQVWKYPKVWEGFIKCCQRTKPQSFQVILQLPPQQLGAVFDKCPELREPLLAHVRSFTPHQVPGGLWRVRVLGSGVLSGASGQSSPQLQPPPFPSPSKHTSPTPS